MPDLKKFKENLRTNFLREQVRIRGVCVKPGMEIWEIANVNLKVGIIEKVDEEEGKIFIKRKDGTVEKRPESCLLFVPERSKAKG